jgi:hypothetical protein
MMARRAVAAASIFALWVGAASCGPAVKHPAITAGLAGALIGTGACELEQTSGGTCLLIGGGAGLFLGGIAALVLSLSPPAEHQILSTEPAPEEEPQFGRKAHHADAGVASDASAVDAAP